MTCPHDETAIQNDKDEQRLKIALVVIASFMIVEVIGGLIASSLALLADAVHMMTDALALGLALSAQWFARRPPDDRRHFGYQRGPVLAAFVNGIVLFALLAWIVFEAVQRFFDPGEVAWRPMLIVAVLGLLANFIAFRILHPSGATNINVRGALLHVMSDMLGSVAAVCAALAIAFTGAHWMDPLLSLVVAVLIARSAAKLVSETGHILLEGAPAHINVAALSADLAALSEDIEDVHGVHIWQMKPGDDRILLHARLRDGADGQPILDRIKTHLADQYGILDSTVQIETGGCCEIDPLPAARLVAGRPPTASVHGAGQHGHDAHAHAHVQHVGEMRPVHGQVCASGHPADPEPTVPSSEAVHRRDAAPRTTNVQSAQFGPDRPAGAKGIA